MDCVCTIDDIEKICGGETNAPDLMPELAITCIDEVTTIPAPAANTHEIAGNITMRAAASGPPAIMAGRFRKWPFELKGSSFKSSKDENGSWNSEVKVFIPKLKKDNTYVMSGINGNNYVAVIQDMNQEGKRILGDKINGCMVTVEEATSPKNGYNVTITWTSAKPPYWYAGTITY